MKKKTDQIKDFSERFQKGLDLSFKKLVKAKQQNNGMFVFSENGKLIRIKAKDIKL